MGWIKSQIKTVASEKADLGAPPVITDTDNGDRNDTTEDSTLYIFVELCTHYGQISFIRPAGQRA